jgi:hypothetical protein
MIDVLDVMRKRLGLCRVVGQRVAEIDEPYPSAAQQYIVLP